MAEIVEEIQPGDKAKAVPSSVKESLAQRPSSDNQMGDSLTDKTRTAHLRPPQDDTIYNGAFKFGSTVDLLDNASLEKKADVFGIIGSCRRRCRGRRRASRPQGVT